jgi:hypothetical protein
MPDGKTTAVWQNGEAVASQHIEDGNERVTITAVLSIVAEPQLMKWARTRVRPLYLIPYFEWETIEPFQRRVVRRISEVQLLSSVGGSLEALVWDWEPGQATGRAVTNVLGQRTLQPFELRGHTLYYRDRVTNVYASLAKEMKFEVRTREPLNGELFPDSIDEF